MSKRAKMVDRVKIMIRKAKDEGSTEEETSSLMAKVAQLTEDYLIEEHELAETEQSHIQLQGGAIPIIGSMGYMSMLCELGDLFGCTVAFSGNEDKMIVSARKSVAESYKEVMDYLTAQILAKVKEAGPIIGPTMEFVDGLCFTICDKIAAQRAGMADRKLPVITEQKATENHLNNHADVHTKEVKPPPITLSSIYGMLAGESVEINKKV